MIRWREFQKYVILNKCQQGVYDKKWYMVAKGGSIRRKEFLGQLIPGE